MICCVLVAWLCIAVANWESGEVKQKHVPGKKDLKGVAWGVVFHPEGFLVGASGGGGGFISSKGTLGVISQWLTEAHPPRPGSIAMASGSRSRWLFFGLVG